MKLNRNNFTLLGILVVTALAAPASLIAATNGFIIPAFRGSANTQAGYWESFLVPVGAPGNLPDQPGATTSAVLIQSDSGAIMAGSGNLYNSDGVSGFTLTNATPFTLGTVILQVRTGGTELDYNSVTMNYTDTNGGRHVLAPLFRYELSRISAGPQGYSVSSLWQWDLTGVTTSNYNISFTAAGSSLSLDSITLDTSAPIGTNFIDSAAFAQQPFKLQSTVATLARWDYLASDFGLTRRSTASVFGALGNGTDFDSRDAQYLVGWSTTNRIPAGQGAKNYLVRRVRVTFTISSNPQYIYTGTLRDYRSYLPTSDPRYVAPATTNCPVELFGAGFRDGYTAATYLQDDPWATNGSTGYYASRIAYAAGFDTNGVLVDVSNNIGDDGTNEVVNPFEVAPFAVGQTTNALEGQLVPKNSQMTFDLNLDDPLIYGYVQNGLNNGNLSFIASCLIASSQAPAPPNYPAFYTIFSPIATNGQFPMIDLEGEIVRPNVDSDADGLSDDWENFYFGSLANGETNDPDGDGRNNLAEYQAGTIPVATTNVFKVLSLQHTGNTADLHFASAPNRPYAIQWSTNLQSWQSVTNPSLYYSSAWLAKSGTNLTYPTPVYTGWRDTNATGPQRFYRVSTQ
jgi:hypothetical protein